MTLPAKWIAIDPGEDTGWSVWSKDEFVIHGTTQMWDFSDCIWAEVLSQIDAHGSPLPEIAREEMPDLMSAISGISLLVVEEWRLYPWVLKTGALDFDECRTARLIGSLYEACRVGGWKYEQQSAKIKDSADAAGAESYFSKPLKENRHQNDATRHGWWYIVFHGKNMSELRENSERPKT